MYAIVDIETTGGSPVKEKITEIAIYIYDGNNIVDEFISLVNPEKKIPYYISQLTGISNSMVANAPKFYEIAKHIINITTDKVFVAHNVNFDYNFIVNEFKQLGYKYFRNTLCTVQLSRKIIPGCKSYSLGKLCVQLGINIKNRHRASGDALATVQLLQYLQAKSNNELINHFNIPNDKNLHPNFDTNELKNIPEEPGVYYFFNELDELIYIGKSKNIRTRILTHFRNTKSKKAIEMRDSIASIDYTLTGNELIALLKESEEIKQHCPRYNRAQRRAISSYGIYDYVDSAGYIRFEIIQTRNRQVPPIVSFSNAKSTASYMQSLVSKYKLCQKLCGLYKTNSSCFHYEIHECLGACIGNELPESYNKRATYVIESHKYRHNSFFIIEQGRSDNEYATIMVENGIYNGYGYIHKEYAETLDLLKDSIKTFPDNRDIQQILRSYLKKNHAIDIINF